MVSPGTFPPNRSACAVSVTGRYAKRASSSAEAPIRNLDGAGQPSPRIARTCARWFVAWPTPRTPPLSLRPTGRPASRTASATIAAVWGPFNPLAGRGFHEVRALGDRGDGEGPDRPGLDGAGLDDGLPRRLAGGFTRRRKIASERAGLVHEMPGDRHVDLVGTRADGRFYLGDAVAKARVRDREPAGRARDADGAAFERTSRRRDPSWPDTDGRDVDRRFAHHGAHGAVAERLDRRVVLVLAEGRQIEAGHQQRTVCIHAPEPRW
jgi:hypothetical protein